MSTFDQIRKEMQKDEGWAWSWHCSIAMAFYDKARDQIGHDLAHRCANEAAASFMNSCFDVDTSKFNEYEY